MTTSVNKRGKPPAVARPRSKRWPTLRRDTIIWCLGIGIAVNEALIQPKAQSEVLLFAAGLLGLPGILAANEYGKKIIAAVNVAAAEAEGGDP